MLKFKDEILNYVYILLGSLIMAFGVVSFLSPNHIATGGTFSYCFTFSCKFIYWCFDGVGKHSFNNNWMEIFRSKICFKNSHLYIIDRCFC